MTDPAVVQRRLHAILAKRRPDLDEDQREVIADTVLELLDLRGDLTYFWMGVYGVRPV